MFSLHMSAERGQIMFSTLVGVPRPSVGTWRLRVTILGFLSPTQVSLDSKKYRLQRLVHLQLTWRIHHFQGLVGRVQTGLAVIQVKRRRLAAMCRIIEMKVPEFLQNLLVI